VVAAALAERVWTVMRRGMPYVVCDTDGHEVTPDQAKKTIAERWNVPSDVRARRRSRKTPQKPKVGKAPQQVLTGHDRSDATGIDKRGDLPRPGSSRRPATARKAPCSTLLGVSLPLIRILV
jgi:hypothetical protein